MNRKRKVFGRLKLDLGDMGKWRIEMHRDGLLLRQKHKRRIYRVSWPQLVDSAVGQMRLL